MYFYRKTVRSLCTEKSLPHFLAKKNDYDDYVIVHNVLENQLLQLCMAHTAWDDSIIRSDSVIKLVSVLFGKSL